MITKYSITKYSDPSTRCHAPVRERRAQLINASSRGVPNYASNEGPLNGPPSPSAPSEWQRWAVTFSLFFHLAVLLRRHLGQLLYEGNKVPNLFFLVCCSE